jgi:hypothetical protein
MMVNELSMYRGNDRTVQITILDKATGLPYTLTSCTVTMLVKHNINDADVDAIITKVTTDPTEGVITNPTAGVTEFYLVPSDTLNADTLNDNVPYPIDFRVETPHPEKLYTVLRTWLTILTR